MSLELQFQSSCSGTEIGTAKNDAAHNIDLIKTNFTKTLSDGTYLQVSVYASNGTGLISAGDLVDWTANYQITIEKVEP